MVHLNVLSGLEWTATGFLACMLAWICVTDFRHFQIPDAASLGLVAAGLILSVPLTHVTSGAAVLGAVLGYVSFAVLGAVYFRHTAQDGLGLGDAKLLAAAGAWLGASDLPLLVAAAASGALGFAILTCQRRLAFGPWLSGAFWMIWIVRISA